MTSTPIRILKNRLAIWFTKAILTEKLSIKDHKEFQIKGKGSKLEEREKVSRWTKIL
jgi:hypothetical protein